jgi:hypothetical protein
MCRQQIKVFLMNSDKTGKKISIPLRVINILILAANMVMGFFLSIQMFSRSTYEEISSSIYPINAPLMNSNVLDYFFKKEVGIFIILVLVVMMVKEFIVQSFHQKATINILFMFLLITALILVNLLLFSPIHNAT